MLKTCPCCGGEARITEKKLAKFVSTFRVECEDCKLQTTHFYDLKKAVSVWNKRMEEVDITSVTYSDEQIGRDK